MLVYVPLWRIRSSTIVTKEKKAKREEALLQMEKAGLVPGKRRQEERDDGWIGSSASGRYLAQFGGCAKPWVRGDPAGGINDLLAAQAVGKGVAK